MPDRQKVEQNKKEFPPGSQIAIDNGCTCPVKENHNGKGYNKLPYMWLINSDCELHWCTDVQFKKQRNKQCKNKI